MRVEMAWSTTRSVACVWACTAATYPSGRKGCRGVSLKWRGTLGGAGIGENDTQGSHGARGVQAPVDGVDACAALVAHDLIDPAPAGQGAHGRLVRRPGLGQQGHAAAKGMSHDPAPRARAQSPASVTGGDHRGGDVDVLGPPSTSRASSRRSSPPGARPAPGRRGGPARAGSRRTSRRSPRPEGRGRGAPDRAGGARTEAGRSPRHTAWSAPAVGGPGGSGRCPERRTRTETGRCMTLS